MGDPRHDLGIAAEGAVAAWLEGSGWRVLGRRVRASGGGEVDIVALDPERVLVAWKCEPAGPHGPASAPSRSTPERVRRTASHAGGVRRRQRG